MNVIIIICILIILTILIIIGLLSLFKCYNKKEYKLEGGVKIYGSGCYFLTIVKKVIYETSLEGLIKKIMDDYGDILYNLMQNDGNYTLKITLIHSHFSSIGISIPSNFITKLILNDIPIVYNELSDEYNDYSKYPLRYIKVKTLFTRDPKNEYKNFKIICTNGSKKQYSFIISAITDQEIPKLDSGMMTEEINKIKYLIIKPGHAMIEYNQEYYGGLENKNMENLIENCFNEPKNVQGKQIYDIKSDKTDISLYYSDDLLTTINDFKYFMKIDPKSPDVLNQIVSDFKEIKAKEDQLALWNTKFDYHKLTMIITNRFGINVTKINDKYITEDISKTISQDPDIKTSSKGYSIKLGEPVINPRTHKRILNYDDRYDTCYVHLQFSIKRDKKGLKFYFQDNDLNIIKDKNRFAELGNYQIWPCNDDGSISINYVTDDREAIKELNEPEFKKQSKPKGKWNRGKFYWQYY